MVGRGWVYGLLERVFEHHPGRTEQDGAFMAKLLDTAHVVVGQEWWIHRSAAEKDTSFPSTHHQHHWRYIGIACIVWVWVWFLPSSTCTFN